VFIDDSNLTKNRYIHRAKLLIHGLVYLPLIFESIKKQSNHHQAIVNLKHTQLGAS
jgi:hypothetical protein